MIATAIVLGVMLMHVVRCTHGVMMRRPTRQPRHRRHALNRERQNAKPDEEDLEQLGHSALIIAALALGCNVCRFL
ncbi:hypothetical protein [Aquabacterium sp.]|uniref:hypothetical protein n=1 Tax=Aquabacterium sp. TaxID=1872578 RepID=UPI00248839B3|nr:hypothetical protein [Aquabacterium sp.]MDI1261507.1 hypothetical protein [Aquabacterium sp.]